MEKQRLLSLLEAEAGFAFERAKRMALARGGLVTPLHLLVCALENLVPQSRATASGSGRQASLVLDAAEQRLIHLFPDPSDSLTVTKETQDAIESAGRIASACGRGHISPIDLVRACSVAPSVAGALSDIKVPDSLKPFLDGLDCGPAGSESPVSLNEGQAGRPGGADQNAAGAAGQPASSPGAQVARSAMEPARLPAPLELYCDDVLEKSKRASAHPFVGRQLEVTAVIETLCRKMKSNPLLIGSPGVGKSALVAAVAARLAEGSVPPRLRGKRILEVSRIKLIANAKYSGDLEDRLRGLIESTRQAGNIILFFDEFHTLLGAGGVAGTGDAASLLKTALSSGDIACIGATTLSEYYKHVAPDEALARRFSPITIEEPTAAATIEILAGARASFEEYHGLEIDDAAIERIVDMAARFLPSRSFPDKALDLMDKASAKAALDGQRQLSDAEISAALSEMTGLPLDLMRQDPVERLERLEEALAHDVPGQDAAAKEVARIVRIAKLGLDVRPERPDGVFLFVGPEGIGKHEMAEALAQYLFGSTRKLMQFDMSQFSGEWSLSRLVGASPGYVGYADRSGLLVKAVEENPHSVLYLKNIDHSHEIVQEFLAEALDQGRFVAATGAEVLLSNVTVIMGLSRSAEHLHRPITGFARGPGESCGRPAGLSSRYGLSDQLASVVDDVIEFRRPSENAVLKMIEARLESLRQRFEKSERASVRFDPALAGFIASRLESDQKDAAGMDKMIEEVLVVPLSTMRVPGPVAGSSGTDGPASGSEVCRRATQPTASSGACIQVTIRDGQVKIEREPA